MPDTPQQAPWSFSPDGGVEIELPRARLLLRGAVDLAVLKGVLTSLSR
jgi:hypothetical protein